MYVTIKNIFNSTTEVFIDSKKQIEQFQNQIELLLSKLKKNEILIIDFRRFYIPRRRVFDNAFIPLYEKKGVLPLVIVNLENPDRLKESPLEKYLHKSNIVLPVISPIGDVHWIGVKNKKIGNICELMYENLLDKKERTKYFDPKTSVFLEKNHWLNYVTRTRILPEISEKFEGYLFQKFIDELKIKEEGHFLLPCGEHTQTAFDCTKILNDPELIEEIAFEIIKRIRKFKIDVILCHSLVATLTGKKIAAALNIDYFIALGYPFPIFQSMPIIKNRNCLILTTVIRSGKAHRNLIDYVKEKGGRATKSITIIDTRVLSSQDIETETLLSYPIESTTEKKCQLCKKDIQLQKIEYFTGAPISEKEGEEFPSLLKDEEFWRLCFNCNAIRRGHIQVNGHHFSLYIETHKIFKNEKYAAQLSKKVLAHFKRNFDVVLHPINAGAILFASKLVELINSGKEKHEEKSVVVPVGKSMETNDFIVPDFYKHYIQEKNILIIDDGVNFGTTLAGLHFAAKELNPKIICHAVFVNRLGKTYRKILRSTIKDFRDAYDLTSLYNMKIYHVYRPWECPMCNKLKELKSQRKLRHILTSEARAEISHEIDELEPIFSADGEKLK